MGAPLGNKFWELRSKHGRKRLFETPELLWEAACEYFEWVEENPLYEVDFVGKDAMEVNKPHTRPFTYQGLCMYLDCNVQYFNEFEESLKGKEDENSKGFSAIITRIREVVYRQKFEGAACGFYNHNIIARDLGLMEQTKIDHTNNGNSFNTLSDAELVDRVTKLLASGKEGGAE
jgi:hypothetical protein